VRIASAFMTSGPQEGYLRSDAWGSRTPNIENFVA
jgi:hypothetical protein